MPLLEDGAEDVLEHPLGEGGVIVEIKEGSLRLAHPEFGKVPRGVGVLGTEGRSEGVALREGGCVGLDIELSGDGHESFLAEEVLCIVDLSVLSLGDVLEIKRRDAEHLAGALAVRGCDERG